MIVGTMAMIVAAAAFVVTVIPVVAITILRAVPVVAIIAVFAPLMLPPGRSWQWVPRVRDAKGRRAVERWARVIVGTWPACDTRRKKQSRSRAEHDWNESTDNIHRPVL